MTQKTIAIANDHAGTGLKKDIVALLEAEGFTVVDLGCDGSASVDYPDYADKMAETIAAGTAAQGILICGTGIGISIAANRHRHIRAALCHSTTDARLCRQHNNANILALGARTSGPEVALDCVRVFIATEFEGGRHARRVDKMS